MTLEGALEGGERSGEALVEWGAVPPKFELLELEVESALEADTESSMEGGRRSSHVVEDLGVKGFE